MALPAAFSPLRHPTFRALWIANVATSLGTWMQSTGAGWLMATLAPDPLLVALVQAATLLPVFLLALPAGALADIVDRRRYLLATQGFMMLTAILLAVSTGAGIMGPWLLLAFTFALGCGQAMTMPAWAATVPETVPREDLIQAIALNGIGFNAARAVGPAIAGAIIAFSGPAVAFAFNAASFVVVIVFLLSWKRDPATSKLPPEHFLSAMRTGVRFVSATPALRAAIVRAIAYFAFTSAPWGLLPLVVKDQLGRGADIYGVLLGAVGVGAVAGGFVLAEVRKMASRGTMVFAATLVACLGMVLLAVASHWILAFISMLMFGLGWIGAASTLQASAQLATPAWVRARALGIYQLSFFGALAFGAAFWGWLAGFIGIPQALLIAAALGAALAVGVRGFSLESAAVAAPAGAAPAPEPPAPELADLLPASRGWLMETLRYQVAPADRSAFLAAMADVELVRRRAGAVVWRLFEDVAHPDRWLEVWAMESWADHLREESRLGDADHAALTHARSFHAGAVPIAAERYLRVDPVPAPATGGANRPPKP